MPFRLKEPAGSPVVSPGDALREINLTRAWWILVVTTICTVLFTIAGRITGTSAACGD